MQERHLVRYLYKMFDTDGDGMICKKEFAAVLRAITKQQLSKLSDETLAEIVAEQFREINPDDEDKISFKDFRDLMFKNKQTK